MPDCVECVGIAGIDRQRDAADIGDDTAAGYRVDDHGIGQDAGADAARVEGHDLNALGDAGERVDGHNGGVTCLDGVHQAPLRVANHVRQIAGGQLDRLQFAPVSSSKTCSSLADCRETNRFRPCTARRLGLNGASTRLISLLATVSMYTSFASSGRATISVTPSGCMTQTADAGRARAVAGSNSRTILTVRTRLLGLVFKRTS